MIKVPGQDRKEDDVTEQSDDEKITCQDAGAEEAKLLFQLSHFIEAQ